MKGLIFAGAYVRSEICVSKSIGLPLFLEGNLPFYFVFQVQVQDPSPDGGGAIFRCEFGGFLYMEGLIFGILRYSIRVQKAVDMRYKIMKQFKLPMKLDVY